MHILSIWSLFSTVDRFTKSPSTINKMTNSLKNITKSHKATDISMSRRRQKTAFYLMVQNLLQSTKNLSTTLLTSLTSSEMTFISTKIFPIRTLTLSTSMRKVKM